jgi:hypothetical protein
VNDEKKATKSLPEFGVGRNPTRTIVALLATNLALVALLATELPFSAIPRTELMVVTRKTRKATNIRKPVR